MLDASHISGNLLFFSASVTIMIIQNVLSIVVQVNVNLHPANRFLNCIDQESEEEKATL